MRLSRRNSLLAGLLGALIAANVGFDLAAGGDPLPEPLFASLDPARAARVMLEGPGGSLTLARTADGWTLASLGGFPALDWTVEDQLRRLVGVSDVDLVSDSAGDAETYGLGAEARRVTITDVQGTVLADFHQGTGAGAGSYLRPVSGNEVFRAPAVGRFEHEPSRWFDPHLVLPSPEPIAGLRWSSTDNDGELQRDSQGRWVRGSDGLQVSGATVDALLSTLRNLLFSEVHERAPEGDLQVELLGPDGATLTTLLLGKTQGETAGASNAAWGGRFEVRLPASSTERVRAGLSALLR